MPSNCAVATCKLSGMKLSDGTHLSFFRFPKTDELRRIWIKKCNRADDFNVNTSRICSQHFTRDDFLKDMKSELLNLPPKTLLKRGAIPTLNLKEPSKHNPANAISASERASRCMKRNQVKEAKDFIQSIYESQVDVIGTPEESQVWQDVKIENEQKDFVQSVYETTTDTSEENWNCQEIKEENARLQAENDLLKAENFHLKSDVQNLKRRINSLQTNLNRHKRRYNSNVPLTLQRSFVRILSEAELKMIVQKKQVLK